MRLPLLSLVVVLVGCAKTPTTPAGSLAHVDLRPHLPKDAPPPPATGAKAYERTFTACEGIQVTVSWRAFESGTNKYLLDVDVALTKAQDAVEVNVPTDVAVGGKSLNAGAPWIGVADVKVRCHKKTLTYEGATSTLVQVYADGEGSAT